MTAKRKAKVYWTDEEMQKVIDESVRIALEDREYVWAYVAKGQKVLPEERRRNISGKHGINEKIMEEFCRTRQETVEEGIPFQVNIEHPPVEVLVERPREDILKSITTEELIGLIAKRVAPIIEALPGFMSKGRERQIVSETLQTGSGQRVAQPSSVSTPRKAKVLLYGFLPGQETDIREKAKGTNLELVFALKDSRMMGTFPACQWCVMMMKSSHAASGKLKKNFGNKILVVHGVDGAVKSLWDIHSQVGMGVR